MNSSFLSTDEKRAALTRVLQSRSLGRAEQLRTLLRYVCDAEFDGKAHELNEYALGVFAFGRPPDYSPAEDSCVRSRAHELRHRLNTYYESEAPSDPVRIHIAKGGYVPRFIRTTTDSQPPSSREDDEIRRFWAPFMRPEEPLVFVLDGACADIGAVHAGLLLGRMLGARGCNVVLKAADTLSENDLCNNNVVFLGTATPHPLTRKLLEKRAFVTDEFGVIHNVVPRANEQERYENACTDGSGEKYALITKVRGPRAGRHVLMLGGCQAELWALAEAVTNPLHIVRLRELLTDDESKLPNEFELVIEATLQDNVPTAIRCVAHRVL
jgi:hypothetical protein